MIELDLKEILRRLIEGRGLGPRAAMSQAYLAWEAVVGPEVARHVQPEMIRRGVLHLVADSGVWSQEVSFARTDILGRLAASGIPIQDLRLRQGTLPEFDRLPLLTAQQRAPEPPPGDLPGLVSDDRLRSALEELLSKAERKGSSSAPPHRR